MNAMPQREYCSHCLYPQTTCLCHVIRPLSNRCKIDILQHPSEQKAAKNTARLVALCAQNTHIHLGETPRDFSAFHQQLNADTHAGQSPPVVVYPNPHSQPLDAELKSHHQDLACNGNGRLGAQHTTRFIFLDGTWKKAYKMWQLNPWLHHYPSVHLTAESGEYHIRKAPKAGCLSTLEAIALCLQHHEAIDVTPLYACLHAMQRTFLPYRE